MIVEQQLIYSGKSYSILSVEQEHIIHPVAFGMLPLSAASLQCNYSGFFHLEDYQLKLDKLLLHGGDSVNAASKEQEKIYDFMNCTVSYNGAILIANKLLKEYFLKSDKPACFSYQNVIELVFEDGVLITAVDQSRAMQRIRKNLELGLRILTDPGDVRCIQRFMNSSFIGDYKPFLLNRSRMKYLKEMKNDYPGTTYIRTIHYS